jgi:protein-tyrosine phosphatase
VIDLHTHVLPGLDDGARDVEAAVAMCRAAAEDGIDTLAGTPHVRSDHPTTPEAMLAALAALREAVGDLVQLLPGGEIDLRELDRPIEELAPFALAGNPRYLLVETPYYGWPLDLTERLFRLRAAGITPVLAHPERNYDVQSRPELLEPIVAGGTLVQMTAASVDGRSGVRAKACAEELLGRGLAHLLASDAHEAGVRAIGMKSAAQAVGGQLARWLTFEVPNAIVTGGPLPPRPDGPSPRRFLAWASRRRK